MAELRIIHSECPIHFELEDYDELVEFIDKACAMMEVILISELDQCSIKSLHNYLWALKGVLEQARLTSNRAHMN